MSLVCATDLTVPLFIFIIFLFLLFKSVNKKSSGGSPLPPGPRKLPLIGSLLHMMGPLPHHTLKDLASKHGPLMHLQLGQISAVIVSSPPVAKQVMKTHDFSFASRPSLLATETVLYNGKDVVFAPYGDYWRQMRKIATMELLSAKKVRSFNSIREEEVQNLVESINSSSSGSLPIDLTQKIFSLIIGIVARSSFGNKCKDQESFIKLAIEVASLAGGFDVADLFPLFKLLHLVTGLRPKLENLSKDFDRIIDTIVNDRIQEKANNTSLGTEDLVDVLLPLKDDGGFEFPITLINIKAIILISTLLILVYYFSPLVYNVSASGTRPLNVRRLTAL